MGWCLRERVQAPESSHGDCSYSFNKHNRRDHKAQQQRTQTPPRPGSSRRLAELNCGWVPGFAHLPSALSRQTLFSNVHLSLEVIHPGPLPPLQPPHKAEPRPHLVPFALVSCDQGKPERPLGTQGSVWMTGPCPEVPSLPSQYIGFRHAGISCDSGPGPPPPSFTYPTSVPSALPCPSLDKAC